MPDIVILGLWHALGHAGHCHNRSLARLRSCQTFQGTVSLRSGESTLTPPPHPPQPGCFSMVTWLLQWAASSGAVSWSLCRLSCRLLSCYASAGVGACSSVPLTVLPSAIRSAVAVSPVPFHPDPGSSDCFSPSRGRPGLEVAGRATVWCGAVLSVT